MFILLFKDIREGLLTSVTFVNEFTVHPLKVYL